MTKASWRYLFDDQGRQAAEDKYRELRALARALTLERLAEAGVVIPETMRLEEIGFDALKAVDLQWRLHGRKVDWPWEKEFRYWRKKRHDRWNLAIWHESELCLLALGGPSRRRTILHFHGVERHPRPQRYTSMLLPIALQVAEVYAALIGADEVRIRKPHPLLIAKYEELGYTLYREPFKFWLWRAVKLF